MFAGGVKPATKSRNAAQECSPGRKPWVQVENGIALKGRKKSFVTTSVFDMWGPTTTTRVSNDCGHSSLQLFPSPGAQCSPLLREVGMTHLPNRRLTKSNADTMSCLPLAPLKPSPLPPPPRPPPAATPRPRDTFHTYSSAPPMTPTAFPGSPPPAGCTTPSPAPHTGCPILNSAFVAEFKVGISNAPSRYTL